MSGTTTDNDLRRLRRQDQRRQAILDAAATVFADEGYDKATLEAIGDLVGLSKGSLYYYVRSKEELLGRLLVTAVEAIEERCEATRTASPPERLRTFLRAHVEVACTSPPGRVLAENLDQLLRPDSPAELRAARRRHERHLQEILDSGMRESSFRPLDLHHATRLLLGALNAVPRWAKDTPPEEIADTLASLVLDGIAEPTSPDAGPAGARGARKEAGAARRPRSEPK